MNNLMMMMIVKGGRMSNDDFNKACAGALGWESFNSRQGIAYALPESIRVYMRFSDGSDMHFHDSYDWAMLLVAKLTDIQLAQLIDRLGIIMQEPRLSHVFKATPLQISQACLEVLGGN